MFAKERQEKMEQIIVNQGSASVQELSELFGVSEVTVRKDLIELSKNDLIMRIHGGAVAKYQSAIKSGMNDLVLIHKDEKRRIAKRALEFIKDGDSILLDTSSTVTELALLINESNFKNLTVITPSILNAQVLSNEDIRVIVIGGKLNRRLTSMRGPFAIEQINLLSADKCFIGVNGVDHKFGYSTCQFEDSVIKKAILNASKQSFVLADHSKMHKRYLVHIEKLDEVDYIITDSYDKNLDYADIESKVTVIYAD